MFKLRFLCIILLLFVSQIALAQLELDILVKARKPIQLYTGEQMAANRAEKLDEGTEFKIVRSIYANEKQVFVVNSGSGYYYMYPEDLKRVDYLLPDQSIDNLWKAFILKSDFIKDVSQHGWDYELYNQMEEEILEYNMQLEDHGFIYMDEYVEDYVYQLIHKVFPGDFLPGRPGNLNISIIYSQNPNAFAASNGTIFITTGMLSLISSEEELLGVLAHEIAHIILSHQIINYHFEEARQIRAQFWTGFGTVLGTLAGAYVGNAAWGGNSFAAAIGFGVVTYVTSRVITNDVLERLGAKYTQEQEIEADNIAGIILERLGYDKLAFASVLEKLRRYGVKSGNYNTYNVLSSHPALGLRIREFGIPDISEYSSNEYLQLTSRLNSLNAQMEYANRHFKVAEELVEKNIQTDVATETDYLLKSALLRYQHYTDSTNHVALAAVQKAKELNVNPPLGLHKEEALVYLRLERYNEASEAFNKYLDMLNGLDPESCLWGCEAVESEKRLTKVMIYKTNKFL